MINTHRVDWTTSGEGLHGVLGWEGGDANGATVHTETFPIMQMHYKSRFVFLIFIIDVLW